MMNEPKENPLLRITFQFAPNIVEYAALLNPISQDLSRQLFRSGTSIGANAREAQGAESRADFIHKLKIAYKEAEETEYWLSLCALSKGYPHPGELQKTIDEVKRLLGKIIVATKKR